MAEQKSGPPMEGHVGEGFLIESLVPGCSPQTDMLGAENGRVFCEDRSAFKDVG